ncbi:MAG: hypothetical protein QME68_00630 [Elusimicrobiota bacterium]|nr:hypothetical protein [Elusimicrobiota bacterium]
MLKVFFDITKSDMLHLGYWNVADLPTLENLCKAQLRYTDYIFNKIPENTKTILDVGCRTGSITFKLQNLGFIVDCVSPDLLQKKIIDKKYGNQLTFYCVKFEELNINKSYVRVSQLLNKENFYNKAKYIVFILHLNERKIFLPE